MRVEVISTGTELLRGRSVDTNLGRIARALEGVGAEVAYHATCGDDFQRLVEELKLAASRADACILTGGLGPTEDDLTRLAVEEAFHRKLVFDPALWRGIRARFRKYGIRMAAINRRQAFRPRGAAPLPNPNGSAPGFRLDVDDFALFVLPGPPREMVPMLEKHVVPWFARRVRKDWDLWEGASYGIPEGTVDEIVKKIAGSGYGLTVSGGRVNIFVRAEGPSRKKTLRVLSRRIRTALGFAFLEAPLPELVARILLARKLTVAAAESCTGGLITHKLTEIPGISAALLESCVTYSNGSKVRRLAVPAGLIEKHGAVSAEVAAAMAEGVARSSGADVGVAVTGIAGPTGGTPRKPVGLVYAAVAFGGTTLVTRKVIPGDRSDVKERAANLALNLVRLAIQERSGKREAVGVRGARSRRR